MLDMLAEDASSDSLSVLLIALAVIATLTGWVLTIITISQHFSHWNSPDHQRIIVKMLVLVIIWSTFSLLVVIRPQVKPITQVVMDTYESYLVILFMELMITYLGGFEQVIEEIGELTKRYRLGPFFFTPSLRGFLIMRILVYQFIVIKPALAVIRCVLYYMSYASKVSFDVDPLFTLFRVLMVTSLLLAMLGLLMFYRMFQEKLKPYKVGIKFIAMKLFIFLHLFQGLLFSFVNNSGDATQYLFIARVEYFCVCLEMAFASILNMYVVFTYREWIHEDDLVKPWIEYFRLDEARLNEWKNTLSNPHLMRQDSLAIERTRLPSATHYEEEIAEEHERPKHRLYKTIT